MSPFDTVILLCGGRVTAKPRPITPSGNVGKNGGWGEPETWRTIEDLEYGERGERRGRRDPAVDHSRKEMAYGAARHLSD